MPLPRYEELPPAPGGGRRSAWRLFGAEDNAGLINLQTPERVARGRGGDPARRGVPAERAEVGCSTRRCTGGRRAVHRLIRRRSDTGFDDELDSFNPQSSSQWDSLGTCRTRRDAFYNGATKWRQIRQRPRTRSTTGPAGASPGGGVLLDVEQVLGDGFDPGAAVALSVADLERCRAAAGVECRPGDILVLYTGFGRWYAGPGPSRRGRRWPTSGR